MSYRLKVRKAMTPSRVRSISHRACPGHETEPPPTQKITTEGAASSPMGNPLWETLETCAPAEIQQVVQRLLEDEVDEMLGCAKSERRTPATPAGYRNG